VLLFMVGSSPRTLGDRADRTAADELTLCAWHLADERNPKVPARGLRGVVAETQEPPMTRARAIFAGDHRYRGPTAGRSASWCGGAVVPWPAGQ